MERDLQKIHDVFAKRLAKSKKTLTNWVDSDKDIAFRLASSDHVFEAAAQSDVYGQLVDALARALAKDPESKLTFDSLHEYVMREVLNKSGFVSRSSSQSGNLMAQFRLAAWSKALSHLRTGL